MAFLGIGHPLRGDDASGLLFVRTLLKKLREQSKTRHKKLSLFQEIKISDKQSCLLLEGGASPENFTGLIRQFKPDLLVIIDASDMKSAPGTITAINKNEIPCAYDTSTHRMPPTLLVKYLLIDNPKLKTSWILIQPKSIPLLSKTISKEIKTAILSFIDFILH